MQTYDAIIIGSGQGGTPLARKLAQQGWKTALVERQWIGGTCINTGCTPTKTMIASAKTAYTAEKANEVGIHIHDHVADLPEIIRRKDQVVKQFRDGSRKGLEQTANLELIFGNAFFTGKKQLEVQLNSGGTMQIAAEKIFIDTGGRPLVPDVEGLKDIPYLTSSSILGLQEVPRHLLVIGGGYIGLEFGQMFRRFGSEVTIIQQGERLLSREDQDISDAVRNILQEEGINIYTGAKLSAIKRQDETVTVQLHTNDHREDEISCSHVLVATGRTPNTDHLHLEACGVAVDQHGHIIVNEFLETETPGIYAIGDVKGGPEFTHISYNDYVVLSANLLEGRQVSIKDRLVPYCMFIDPQLGRVGMTEQEAEKNGLKYKVATLPMTHVARAVETGDTRGMMKAIVEEESGKILGAAVLGQEGGEIMTMLQLAMTGGLTAHQLKDMVFAHPLYAESLNNLFMNF